MRKTAWVAALPAFPALICQVSFAATDPAKSFGHLPPYFEPNVGQSSSRADFFTRGFGHSMSLDGADIVVRGTTGAAVKLKLAGAAFWTAQLNAGTSPIDALNGFLGSTEYILRF